MTKLLCTKTLYGLGKDIGRTTRVNIHEPYYNEHEGNWMCLVEFSDLSSVRSFSGRGIDGFQALIVALGAVGGRLESSGVNWTQFKDSRPQEGVRGDDGFPRYFPSVLGAEFRHEMEQVVVVKLLELREKGDDKLYARRAGLISNESA